MPPDRSGNWAGGVAPVHPQGDEVDHAFVRQAS
jgi:hypothetical protein